MKTVIAAIAIALLAFPVAADVLSDSQLQQMTQDVCSVPIHKDARSGQWRCEAAKDYPAPSLDARCWVSFVRSTDGDSTKRTRIFFGQFTTREPQAIAMYESGCESHATNFGGTALFRVANQEFELLRWVPAQVKDDCIVPPARGGGLQSAYCISSHMGQGVASYAFGPLSLATDKSSAEPWITATNLDGHFMESIRAIACGKPEGGIHHFGKVTFERAQVVLEAAAYEPRNAAKACERLRKNEFTDAERDYRQKYGSLQDMAILRAEDGQLLKAFVRFTPPNSASQIEVTTEPVP